MKVRLDSGNVDIDLATPQPSVTLLEGTYTVNTMHALESNTCDLDS